MPKDMAAVPWTRQFMLIGSDFPNDAEGHVPRTSEWPIVLVSLCFVHLIPVKYASICQLGVVASNIRDENIPLTHQQERGQKYPCQAERAQ